MFCCKLHSCFYLRWNRKCAKRGLTSNFWQPRQVGAYHGQIYDPIKSNHPCNEFAPIGAAHPLSNSASSYSGKSYVVNKFHPRTIPPPRSAVLLTPSRSCRAREKHALPCDAPLSLYRCADSRWSGRKVWTWLFATPAAPKGRRRYATFRRVVNYWFLVLYRLRGVGCELMSKVLLFLKYANEY